MIRRGAVLEALGWIVLAVVIALALAGCQNADRAAGVRFTVLGLDIYGQEVKESPGGQTGRYVRTTPHTGLDYTVDSVSPPPSAWTTHQSQCGPVR